MVILIENEFRFVLYEIEQTTGNTILVKANIHHRFHEVEKQWFESLVKDWEEKGMIRPISGF